MRRPPTATLFPYTTLFRSVPGVELAWTAHEHQHDAVHVAVGRDRSGGLQREEVTQREAEKSQRAGMEEIPAPHAVARSEEHTSELQSRLHLVCRLLREKKN